MSLLRIHDRTAVSTGKRRSRSVACHNVVFKTIYILPV